MKICNLKHMTDLVYWVKWDSVSLLLSFFSSIAKLSHRMWHSSTSWFR